MQGIEVWERGAEGVLVELRGEFDQHGLEELREVMSDVASWRRPTVVNLSGVTFLDIAATRELTIRSRLYAHHLTLSNPSWQVRRSVAACGFQEWFDFHAEPDADAEDSECRRAYHERKLLKATGGGGTTL